MEGVIPLDPLTFARDVLRVELWSKQREVLAAVAAHKRVAVKSGNGLGKGFTAAVAALWFLSAHNPAIVLSTAPTFRQVRHILWRQIRQLHRRAAAQLGGKLLDTRWDLAEDRYALGLSAEGADQFQGFHSPNVFIVVDEAEGVSDEIYEAIESVMTSAQTRLLLIGNPTTVTGAFRRAFHEERHLYHAITISALDSPNVQAGRVVVPGLVTAEWIEERRRSWGEDNPIYRARALGEFPDREEDTLIPLTHLEAAVRRWREGASSPQPAAGRGRGSPPQAEALPLINKGEPEGVDPGPIVLGVDVARFGSDRSAILRRRGRRVERIQSLRGLDTMKLAAWVAGAIRETPGAEAVVDEIGVGAGVIDRLRELGLPARGINVARAARQEGLFANLRAEGYWRLRELLAAGNLDLPSDNQLLGELAALRYSYDSQGRIVIESKDAMRSRGLPSPDLADALMLAFLGGPRVRVWV